MRYVLNVDAYTRVRDVGPRTLLTDLYAEISGLISGSHLEGTNLRFAQLYCIPKLHKEPAIKYRPICAAVDSVTTRVNRVLLAILRLVFKVHKRECEQYFRDTGNRTWWIVENSLDFIVTAPDTMTDVFSSDLESMYDNLDQSFVLESVFEEIVSASSIEGQMAISVRLHDTEHGNTNDNAFWGHVDPMNPDTDYITYELYSDALNADGTYVSPIKRILEFIITKVYVQVGSVVYLQRRGIPQGGEASPFLANLALHNLEKKYVLSHPTSPVQHRLWRYMDDFLSCSFPEFALPEVYEQIYPPHTGIRILKNEVPAIPEYVTHAYYLDMHIWVPYSDRTVHVCWYDKRTAFPFDVHKFVHLSSNHALEQVHNIFLGEVVRMYRIHTHVDDFIRHVAMLATFCVREKSYDFDTLERLFRTFVHRIEHADHFQVGDTFVYMYGFLNHCKHLWD